MAEIALRPFTAQDADWLVARHGELYARDEGFDDSFRLLVAEILEVGEAANTLPAVLVGIARAEERRTDRILEMLLKLMEPILLLLLAGAVVFLFLALVVPMMQLSAGMS